VYLLRYLVLVKYTTFVNILHHMYQQYIPQLQTLQTVLNSYKVVLKLMKIDSHVHLIFVEERYK